MLQRVSQAYFQARLLLLTFWGRPHMPPDIDIIGDVPPDIDWIIPFDIYMDINITLVMFDAIRNDREHIFPMLVMSPIHNLMGFLAD